jgi:hypothetical protein
VVLGECDLRYLLGEYAAYYNAERPHQGLGYVPAGGAPPPAEAGAVLQTGVRCAERLGGLLRHYTRAA